MLFFASGCCNRENCPYSHVYYGKDAQFCIEFAKGYCKLGSKCDKPHINECPEYNENKKCPRGKKCPLVHLNKSTKSRKRKIENEDIEVVKKEEKNDFGASYIKFGGASSSEKNPSSSETNTPDKSGLYKA